MNWIRISQGEGERVRVNVIIREAQENCWDFSCHFPCMELLLGVEKVGPSPRIFKPFPLLGWKHPANCDSSGDPVRGQNPSKVKAQDPRPSDKLLSHGNSTGPDQTNYRQGELCPQRGQDVVRNVRWYWWRQGNRLYSDMVPLNLVLVSSALLWAIGNCHPTTGKDASLVPPATFTGRKSSTKFCFELVPAGFLEQEQHGNGLHRSTLRKCA